MLALGSVLEICVLLRTYHGRDDCRLSENARNLNRRNTYEVLGRPPLGRLDLEAYVMHRISVAGKAAEVTFEDRALNLIMEVSGGVPRLINLICDRALMAGARSDALVISTEIVRTSIGSLGLEVPPRGARRWWRWLTRWFANS